MSWVIRRTDQWGGYVAPAGSNKSYTPMVSRARRYTTREAAQADCCGNERPVQI